LAPGKKLTYNSQAFTPVERETIIDISFSFSPLQGAMIGLLAKNWFRINHPRPLKGAGGKRNRILTTFPQA
jgi:phosphotransferase system  glucose/maltose/N-acetylglucosamine-specific IIC component